jgi:hypothetical protein
VRGGIKPLSRYKYCLNLHFPKGNFELNSRNNGLDTSSSGFTSVTLSPEELSTKTLTPRHLQAALEALHRDGIPLLSNAIPTSDLDILNSRMVPEAKHLYALSTTHRTTYDSERSVDYKRFEAMVCGNAESDGGTESHARFHTFLWLV